MVRSTKNTPALQQELMNSEDEMPILHTFADCKKVCEDRHRGNQDNTLSTICKLFCIPTNLSDLIFSLEQKCYSKCSSQLRLLHRLPNKKFDEKCYKKCMANKSKAPEHHSQISEKLAATEDNLLDESTKLLLMVDEMQAQDSMYL